MRIDVVDDGRGSDLPAAIAHDTQRMLLKKADARLLPAVSIPASAGGLTFDAPTGELRHAPCLDNGDAAGQCLYADHD